jgi:arginine decarboxylase
MGRQSLAPLLEGLLAHASRNPAQFHIPGHNQGAAMAPELAALLGERALALDLINIPPLDDLHNPTGIIREAQELAAEAFGADQCLFSVQGTSTAVMAMILSVCGPGEKILLPRNLHRSALTGLILAGAVPVFLAPDLDERLGIAHGISPETVAQALDDHPDAKALFVINPTYFGVATDLAQIVSLAHARGLPVLVDEAHGAHLYFHEALPLSAMQAGADLAATSMHKLGGSLTQTSLLLAREGLVDPHRVRAALSLLTTTSTSYLLLASLDVARRQLVARGRPLLDRALSLAAEARMRINRIPGLASFGAEILQPGTARHQFDPTKLHIAVRGLGITGAEAESRLRAESGVEVEMADLTSILCVISIGVGEGALERLVRALGALAERYGTQPPDVDSPIGLPVPPRLVLRPREAFFAPTESVPLAEAVGRISAESLMVYPPGIPIFLPGEVIDGQNLAYIRRCRQAGLPVQGLHDQGVESIRVVR